MILNHFNDTIAIDIIHWFSTMDGSKRSISGLYSSILDM